MRILIFLHGTLLMHKNAAGKSRKEIIKQVSEQEKSVRDFFHYGPIGNAVNKLHHWVAQGAEVCYLSALTENKKGRGDEVVGRKGLMADDVVLKKYNFPKGKIYHRAKDEDYKDVIERMMPLPDVIIEDDCESIGGSKEMTFTHLKQGLKKKIKSIIVKEFEGIDFLPDDTALLLKKNK